jgi:hypothetical protein
MPIKEKYAPLGAHLRRLAAEHSDITLTYAEIERIIGVRLPRGAQSNPFWEGVHGKPPSRARAWLQAGFVARPDVQHQRIRFHRQAPAARPAVPAARGGQQPGGRR